MNNLIKLPLLKIDDEYYLLGNHCLMPIWDNDFYIDLARYKHTMDQILKKKQSDGKVITATNGFTSYVKNCIKIVASTKQIGLLLIDKDRIVFPENLKRVEFCWNGKDMLRAIEFGYTTGASIADKKRDGKDFIKMLEEQHYEPTSLQVEYSSFHHDHIDGGIEYGIESAHKFVIISKVFHGESEKERELQTQEG